MTLPLAPDAEAIVAVFLRQHPDVVALGASVRLTPPDKSHADPWVMVTQLGDPNVDGMPVDHLLEHMLQLDCYSGGGGAPQAKLLARTARAALQTLEGQARDGATFTSVRFGAGARRSTDTDFKPPRERVTLTAYVCAHP